MWGSAYGPGWRFAHLNRHAMWMNDDGLRGSLGLELASDQRCREYWAEEIGIFGNNRMPRYSYAIQMANGLRKNYQLPMSRDRPAYHAGAVQSTSEKRLTAGID